MGGLRRLLILWKKQWIQNPFALPPVNHTTSLAKPISLGWIFLTTATVTLVGAGGGKGQGGAAAFENTKMGFPITNKLKVILKTGVMQHPVGVAAYRENLAGCNQVMLVQQHLMGAVGNGALVNYRLAIIFTGWLQRFELEQSISGAEK